MRNMPYEMDMYHNMPNMKRLPVLYVTWTCKMEEEEEEEEEIY